jgi:predicted dehydrogenase
VEKPIALSYKDAAEMYALAHEKNRFLFVGQVLRFAQETAILREAVRSGQYGKVLDACFERLSASPKWSQNNWLLDRNKSGLIPFDLHIHDLDLMVSLFGVPEKYSYTVSRRPDTGYPDQFRFFYTYPDFNVAAEAAWFNADIPFTARWRVYFERAMLIYDGKTVTAYEKDKAPFIFDTTDPIKIPTGINLPPTGMFFSELKHFLGCISAGKPSELVPEEQILDVITILSSFNKE